MGNRGIAIIIAVAVIVVGVIAGAVLMNRRGPATTSLTGSNGNIVTTDDQGDAMSGNGTTSPGTPAAPKVLCGDGICSPSETVEMCMSDCVPKDVIMDIDFVYGEARAITVTWTTSEPMTSVVEYHMMPDGGNIVAEDNNLKTQHSVDLTNLQSGGYETRVGGSDASGEEYFVEGYQFEL
jgi:hypothetical protein